MKKASTLAVRPQAMALAAAQAMALVVQKQAVEEK
jgi:hypothetical protein